MNIHEKINLREQLQLVRHLITEIGGTPPRIPLAAESAQAAVQVRRWHAQRDYVATLTLCPNCKRLHQPWHSCLR